MKGKTWVDANGWMHMKNIKHSVIYSVICNKPNCYITKNYIYYILSTDPNRIYRDSINGYRKHELVAFYVGGDCRYV